MNSTITELAKKFFELKKQSQAANDELKKINAEWGDVETQLLDAMVEEGVRSVKIEGLGLFSMSVKNYLSVNAANKPSFFEYLQESGNGAILKLDVNPKTLTAFLGQHLEEIMQKKITSEGLDQIEARQAALAFLNEKGASYFVDRGVSLRKE